MSKSGKGRKQKNNSKNPIKIVGVILLVLLLLSFFGGSWLVPLFTNPAKRVAINDNKPYEPPFINDGEVTFWRANGNDQILSIDVEFAKTEQEITNGMMFRRSMADTTGMLFIFPRSEPRSFWMKNTYVSLDIIYIDPNFQIVSIAEKAEPLSEAPLPSLGGAQYVLEVVGGFCKKHSITAGDYITYE